MTDTGILAAERAGEQRAEIYRWLIEELPRKYAAETMDEVLSRNYDVTARLHEAVARLMSDYQRFVAERHGKAGHEEPTDPTCYTGGSTESDIAHGGE